MSVRRHRHLVHVGLHKTGSTWLQNDVFPQLPGFTFGNFDPVLSALLGNLMSADDDHFFDVAFAAVVAHYEARETRLLLSHEGLSGSLFATGATGRRSARRLASVLPDADVLLLIRNQPEMLLAAYAQYVNEGGSASFSRFTTGDVEGPVFELESLEYHRLLEIYVDLFGGERVCVFPYEHLRNEPTAFLDELHRRYGADLGELSTRRVNVSLSPAGLAVLRTWNRLFRATAFNPSPALRPLPGGRRVRNSLQMHIDPVLRQLVPEAVTAGRLRSARGICARYAAGNRRVEELTGWDLGALGYPL